MKLVTTLTGLFAVVAVALGIYFLFQQDTNASYNLSEGNFDLEISYQNNNSWEYVVTGTVPTPCHSVDVLTDSLNSQQGVTMVLLYVNPPLPGEICTQVVKDIKINGDVTSEPDTTFDLSVVQNEVIENPGDTINEIPQYDFNSAEEYESDGYKLRVVFDRVNEKWGYLVSGTLPNECYNADVQTIIAESFPEQVSLILDIKEPSEDLICTQVIQELQLTGEFSASQGASINFEVVQQ